MKLFIGSDHAGFEGKEELKAYIEKKYGPHSSNPLKIEIFDQGCFSNDRANYADYASKVASHVQNDEGKGLLVCGSGIGVSIVANRFQNIRAALCRGPEEAKLSREHNDSNVLCLGTRISSMDALKSMIDIWLTTPFEGGRHSERISTFNLLGVHETNLSQKISSPEKWILGAVLSTVAYGTILGIFNKHYFESIYTYEDGWIEYGTVAAFCLLFALQFKRVKELWRSSTWSFRSGLVVLALAAVFGAGEEISWGQRIIGHTSSDFFASNNAQGETNLHNLVVNGVSLNKLIFGTTLTIAIIFYLLALPVLYRKKESIKKLADRFAIPIAKNSHIIAYVMLFILATSTGSKKKGELLEFGGAWIFFCVTFFPYNWKIFVARNLK